MIELWIIRHGQTFDNVQQILAGQSPGKLTQLGIKQAKLTGKRLKNELFNKAYVSDLGRTVETFNCIKEQLSKQCLQQMEIQFDQILREKHAGTLQGKPLALFQQMAKESHSDIRKFRAPEGECWDDVFQRAKQYLQMIINTYIRSQFQFQNDQQQNNKDVKDIITTKMPNQQYRVIMKTKNITFPNQLQNHQVVQEESKQQLNKNNLKNSTKNAEKHKILVISHGGFVMELFNAIQFFKSGKAPILKNDISNCSINIVQVYCTNNQKQMKCQSCIEGKFECLEFKILLKNDSAHVQNMKEK